MTAASLQDSSTTTQALPATPPTSSHEPQHSSLLSRPNGLKRGSNIPVPTKHPMTSSSPTTPGHTSASNSPSSRSPMKQREKLDNNLFTPHSAALELEKGETLSEDVLDTFPTTNQAVSELFLKEMMLVLHSSIQQSFTEALNRQMSVIDDLGERVNHVEVKMGEFSEAHNGLLGTHNQLEKYLSSLASKWWI